jgi:ferredoxin
VAAIENKSQWPLLLPKPLFDQLISLLISSGFEVIGPRLEQGAIVYGPIRSVAELPIGWTDRQEAGFYRLEKRTDGAYFAYAVGPHSWKKYLFPPSLRLWSAHRTADGFSLETNPNKPVRYAFIGVRACELRAIAVQDRVFINRADRFADPFYTTARQNAFIVAVECEQPSGTCFCVSMGAGPQIDNHRLALPVISAQSSSAPESEQTFQEVFDLVLTELDGAFVVRAGSQAGISILDQLKLSPASEDDIAEARRRVAQAAQSMGRSLDEHGIHELLHRNQEHPRWEDVAARCLSCTNCTLVCPTCFCSCVEDWSDLTLDSAERVRRWDSCFNPEFARVHSGNYRPTIRGRYRQWLTHKFASWYDQFGVSGCVGCGRCITWCPVGIDVTEEITAIRATDKGSHECKHDN